MYTTNTLHTCWGGGRGCQMATEYLTFLVLCSDSISGWSQTFDNRINKKDGGHLVFLPQSYYNNIEGEPAVVAEWFKSSLKLK